MNRRFFLGTIAAGLTASIDPDKLLWEPGRKLISIGVPTIDIRRGDWLALDGFEITPRSYFRSDDGLQVFLATKTYQGRAECSGWQAFVEAGLMHFPGGRTLVRDLDKQTRIRKVSTAAVVGLPG